VTPHLQNVHLRTAIIHEVLALVERGGAY